MRGRRGGVKHKYVGVASSLGRGALIRSSKRPLVTEEMLGMLRE